MKRTLTKDLIEWKNGLDHPPLIIRGARQVGKSYLIESFGKENFKNLVTINFEEKPYLASCFESLEISSILNRLSQLTQQTIIPGETLLFLDEIQNCIPALKSLRYFKEKIPKLHVIAAGSFLEFVLDNEKDISFPVGRVQFLNMRPMSFVEFLDAISQKGINEILASVTIDKPPSEELHKHILTYVKDFYFVGGMPGVVEKFSKGQSYQDIQRTQASILDFYRLDLAKYGKKSQYKNLEYLFSKAPEFTGQHFKYSKLDPHSSNPSREYKLSLHQLNLARIIHLVHYTSANELPLRAEMDEKKFKLFFLDIGLLQFALEVDFRNTLSLVDIHRGVLAEQFVAQELLAYIDPYIDRHLFYWDRQKTGSTAEVDFVINISGQIVPIEVKAGSTGKLKSLQQFLNTKPAKIGVKISESNLSFENKILSIPFYLISQLPRLIEFQVK